MTNLTHQDILTKAIEKATANGWNTYGKLEQVWQPITEINLTLVRFRGEPGKGKYRQLNSEAVIFNHDFAKALWGEVELSGLDLILADPDMLTGAEGATHYWRYHLQQMVLAEDPIQYLGEHLD